MHRFAAKLAWLAAVIAMVTAVVAPALHSPLHHLQCGDCCDGSPIAPESKTATASHCHAGHSHAHSHTGEHQHPEHADPASAPKQHAPAPCNHSPDDCSLCQVLSQSADTTPVLSLTVSAECVEVLSDSVPFAPALMVIEKPFSRGPPVA